MLERETLLTLISEGCETSFRSFYDHYASNVYRVAFKYLQSEDVANDIVQEVFSTVWQRRTQLSDIQNLDAYLSTMARNATYRELTNWAKEVKSRNEYYLRSTITCNNSEDELLNGQYQELLAEAVAELPPQQQAVFKLVKNEGMSHEMAAAQLGISPGTVKNHMVRALAHIRKRLVPHLTMLAIIFSS